MNMVNYCLEDYYILYLKNIKHLSEGSVKHYLQAIKRVSDYLRINGFLNESLFELNNLNDLEEIKLFITKEYKSGLYEFIPKELKDLDIRGNRMYINGFIHYYNFAQGFEFATKDNIVLLDKPIPASATTNSLINKINRNTVIAKQIIESANYLCEINDKHITFTQKGSSKPFMEAHHLIPLKYQVYFHNSLDVYANVICACPNCHRFLHYGNDDERLIELEKIFYKRADRLWNCGLKISENQFIELSTK